MTADRRTDDETLAGSARDGDEQAFVELFSRYKGVVRSVSNGYFLAGGDREDLFAEGMLGLYTAIKDFDADKSNSFAAFAYLCILRRVISAVKQSGSNKNKALFNYIPLNDAVAEAVADTDSDPLERAILKEQQQSLENKINTRLSAFEKRAADLFMQGYAYEDIAEQCGKTVKAVDGALQRARKKLQEK